MNENWNTGKMSIRRSAGTLAIDNLSGKYPKTIYFNKEEEAQLKAYFKDEVAIQQKIQEVRDLTARAISAIERGEHVFVDSNRVSISG